MRAGERFLNDPLTPKHHSQGPGIRYGVGRGPRLEYVMFKHNQIGQKLWRDVSKVVFPADSKRGTRGVKPEEFVMMKHLISTKETTCERLPVQGRGHAYPGVEIRNRGIR